MRILITARYVTGEAREGGSGRFMRCLADAFRAIGHNVITSTAPEVYGGQEFDLVVVSHPERMAAVRDVVGKKVQISHGIIDDEKLLPGADLYVSVSRETHDWNLSQNGIESRVIGQPVRMREYKRPGKGLRKILVIRREPVPFDPFAFLSEKYELRYSDPSRPIEEQIEWADLCITLGRGALEAMAQGRPVLVADNRPYIGAVGDGYLTRENIKDVSLCNFSGRRYRHSLTREWIEEELAKYARGDADVLYQYALENHDAIAVARKYLRNAGLEKKVSFGVLVNDIGRLDMVFRMSGLDTNIHCHTIKLPTSATHGLNRLLSIIEGEGADIAVLAHQDMYFRQGWIELMLDQLALLPDSWVVAGIIGKNHDGRVRGRFHDTRMPLKFDYGPLPCPAACFDESCIIVNLKKGFRFDERLEGFDLYGTLCCLQAEDVGGTSWIIDAFAEHYCTRPLTWVPDEIFRENFKWLHERFPNARRIDSTVLTVTPEYQFEED